MIAFMLDQSRRVCWVINRVLAFVCAVSVGFSISSADAVAQTDSLRIADQEAASKDARKFAVSMLDTSFSASRQAAIDALSGSPERWDAYVLGGKEKAQLQDLRQLLSTLASIGGENLQSEVKRLLESGSVEEISTFIDSGWQAAQYKDDRKQTWQAAQAPEGSTLKKAADEALRNDSAEVLADFVSTGQDKARADDKRRQVYELVDSDLPTVSANASEAIRIGTDTAIDEFLRYGQFVAADQDAEKMTISQLVELTLKESETATNENNKAWVQADRAARAVEAARVAAEKSRDEAIKADRSEQQASQSAAAAGRMANQAADMADQAVAASYEARVALRDTAAALSRAAAASARAQSAAAQAASAANAASYDAAAAHGARLAAEQARNAAQAAEQSEKAYNYASEATRYAESAGRAAGSAARNADAAATAATEASNAAGESQQVAAEARAGAARARAAAGRARAASNEVDRLVGQIRDLVEQTRHAAREAAEYARASAKAADDAAREAGNAHYAANAAGQHAQRATQAAQKAQENIELAEKIHTQATQAADERLEAERVFLKEQARTARTVQETQDLQKDKEQQRRGDLTKQMEQLQARLPEKVEDFATTDESIDQLRQLALVAAQVGTAAVAGAAHVALESGSNDALIEFAFTAYPDAVYADNLNLINHWALTDSDEEIRRAADEASYEDDATLTEFVNTIVPNMRIPGLLKQTWNAKEGAGPQVQEAADAAIKDGTYKALNDFINEGGYEKSQYLDQIQQAYNLVDTGGKEVQIAAEAAVTGDRHQLDGFIRVEQYRRAMFDSQRDAHNFEINSLLSAGRHAADNASQQAASAQAAYTRASGDAQRASEYAHEAERWSGRAQQSARQAQFHLASAQQSLKFATQHQQRAHQAADAAHADAVQAARNADAAASYAAAAHTAAQSAVTSAASAREFANEAGNDARLATRAANDAYTAAWEKEMSELEQARSASAEDLMTVESTSVLQKLKDAIGQESLDLILDLIGVKDVLKCFHGEVSGCLWTAVGLLPVGKAGKLLKGLPAVRKLIGKTGEIKRAFQYSPLKAALDDALIPVGCVVVSGTAFNWLGKSPGKSYTDEFGSNFEYQFAARKCPIPSSVQRVGIFNRYPINARYAGGKWRNNDPSLMPPGFLEKYPGGIDFNEKGFPIFDNYVYPHDPSVMKHDVGTDLNIKNPTGSSRRDIHLADKQLGIDREYRKRNNLVWHHHEDTGRMQLIPVDLHRAVRHTGGYAMWSKTLAT